MATPYKSQVNQYRRMKIETASPEMLILMLYDGAIKNIKTAVANNQGDENTNLEVFSNMLIKAQNIITELMVSLNFDIGGDIARNLFNIYEYVNYTLAQANINKSNENMDTIIQMLTDLRGTWKEVIQINKEKYPNGIPRPATASGEDTPLTTASEGRVTQSPPPAQEAVPGGTGAPDPVQTSQPTDSASPPAQDQPETPPASPAPPVASPVPRPGQPSQAQVNRQTNRFKQVYGKNLPRKV